WQTWWFLGLVAAAAIGAVAGTVKYVATKKLERKLLLLEKQTALANERSRIAQDMHDDLGARLTEILMANDLAEKKCGGESAVKVQVERVSNLARELIDNLDAIVWAVNLKNDS